MDAHGRTPGWVDFEAFNPWKNKWVQAEVAHGRPMDEAFPAGMARMLDEETAAGRWVVTKLETWGWETCKKCGSNLDLMGDLVRRGAKVVNVYSSNVLDHKVRAISFDAACAAPWPVRSLMHSARCRR